MKTGTIFVLLVLIAAPPLAYSKRESLWGQGVFPDDPKWLSPYKRKHSANSENEIDTQRGTVCETQECKIIAKEFLSSMNKEIDPCDDFYEFACGGWSAKDVIPPSSAVWSRFMIFDNTVKHRIKGVLETTPEPSDILPVRQAKKWYHSCMNTESLDKRGITPIESVLMQVGGWPITMDEEEWNSAEYTWQKVESYYTYLTGSNTFYKILTMPPDEDSKFGILGISPPEKTLEDQLPQGYRNYTGNDYEAYVRLVERAAEMFVKHNHANVPKKKLRKEAEEIVEFEKELFALESSDSFEFDDTYFENLTEWYQKITEANTDSKPEIDLSLGIQNLFDIVNILVDPKTAILAFDTSYLKGLPGLLKKTPARTIVNYIHWTFVGNMLIHTSEHVRNELLAFAWEEYGVKERPPRWFECVRDMKMVHAAAYVFVEKYFKKTTQNAVFEMIKNIQNEMGEKIKTSNWLDAESKIIAKDKLDNMKLFVGFPSWYNNKTAVINFYKGITIGADYFDNVLSFMRLEKKNELRGYLRHSGPDESWSIDPITVNAVYGLDKNTLNLPAVDFQAPLFTQKLPDTVNYGIAGVIVGHEMGHGFDDSGIQFGKDGNETDLSKKILKSYYQRADCFTDQFEDYYREASGSESEGTTERNENPAEELAEITRGENIADTTGIQAVFQAYQKLDKQGDSSRLPGLEEYTEDQLFFLSFAAMWCQVGTPQYEKKLKEMSDVHSPSRLRVIGAVSNTKDFARVFNCPKDSAMNPSNKCNIWEKSESTSKGKQSSMRRERHPWDIQWKTY